MVDSIRELEDKVQASKTTCAIYDKEIKDIEAKLKEKNIDIKNIESALDNIIELIDKLAHEEKKLLAKANKELRRVEKRF
jgi:hypothetical protein